MTKTKLIITEIGLYLLFFIAIPVFSFTSCSVENEGKEIIKQNTDERGLTSVIFKEGKDTFGFDYLTRQEYDSIFICSKCGETGCIYEDIDSRIIEGTDQEITNAIMEVCKERNITDSTAIAWLKGDYYN